MLHGKHIVLGITGSIAAYKACTLARLLVRAGAEVQVVLTPAAREFVTPVTLSALTGKPVVSEFFASSDGTWHSHVDLGRWADLMLVAPATASTLGKMAHGIADNMLVTTYLAMKAPVMVAPAMDLDMYAHPSTTANLATLGARGALILEPEAGELASGLTGKGRMQEPEAIVRAVSRHFARQGRLSGRRVLVTAGPTYEKIDPVRFVGNYSSGKMGFALAEAAAEAGAEVELVSGPVALAARHPAIRRTDVESAAEMYAEATRLFGSCDAAVLSAAVADFRAASRAGEKIKRTGEELTLRLEPTQDIAAALGRAKRAGQRLVGFALETDDGQASARRKLESKNLDFIVLNSLRDAGAGFGTDTNKVTLISARDTTALPLQSKHEVARAIIDRLCALFD